MVVEIYKTVKLLTDEKGIDLRVTTDERLPKITFDRDMIIQVITNFVNNAIKFTDEGSIEVSVERNDNVVHVTVKDTGIGFDDKDKDKLFKSFEQLAGGKKYSGGTGLGLAISKEIIDKHNGKIWASSEEGKGSAFGFAIPVVERRGRG